MNGISGEKEREAFSSLEAQLRSTVRLQLENTRDSIRALAVAPDKLRESGASLSQVSQLAQQSEGLISNYPLIKQLSRTHQNFNMTKRVYEEFCALDAKVERCAALLEQDQETGQADNLLLVYYYLSKLELFRNQTLELMKDAPSTAVYTIKRYFKKLDDLTNAFDEFFWKLPRQMFTMVAAGQSTYLVNMVKVLCAMDATQRPKFHTIVDDMISIKFTSAVHACGVAPAEDVVMVLDSLSFWRDDLLLARNELVPKFPPSFNVMDFFVLTYHRNVHAVMAQCLAPQGKLGPADILFIIGWVRSYHEDISNLLGISAEDLEPRLLDDRENALIAEYVALSRGKLNEWINNLLVAETKSFVERSAQPDTDAENHFMTAAGIDLFQIVKQHMDMAMQASKGRLLLEITGECVKALNSFIAGMARVLEGEKVKYLEKPPESVPAYFEDYVIMLGNTCLKWVSYLDDLVNILETELAAEFVAAGTKTMKSVGDAFVEVAKTCTLVLAEIIFKYVRPALQQLFTSSWYEEDGNIMGDIVATFDDFFKDYETHADTFLLNKLVSAVMERLFFAYLEQLRHKSSKLKMPQAPELLTADVNSIIEFFSMYREPERTKKAMNPLSKFIALVGSSERMLFLEFFAFWKVYPDLPMGLFEDVLSRRDDLDRSSIKEIVEGCRKKTMEDKVVESSPSIFAKIKS